MHRRQFLATAASAATVTGLAGCSGDGGAGPEQPIRDVVSALESQDADAYRAAFHPDSPERPRDDAAIFEDFNVEDASVERTEVVSEGDGRATVEAELSTTSQADGQTRTQQSVTRFELRRYDGEWRIWSSEEVGGSAPHPQSFAG